MTAAGLLRCPSFAFVLRSSTELAARSPQEQVSRAGSSERTADCGGEPCAAVLGGGAGVSGPPPAWAGRQRALLMRATRFRLESPTWPATAGFYRFNAARIYLGLRAKGDVGSGGSTPQLQSTGGCAPPQPKFEDPGDNPGTNLNRSRPISFLMPVEAGGTRLRVAGRASAGRCAEAARGTTPHLPFRQGAVD